MWPVQMSCLNDPADDEKFHTFYLNMWDANLEDFAEKDSVHDDVLYLKSDCVVEDEDSLQDKPLDMTYVCWNKDFNAELVSLAVHPSFPAVAHVAVGSCDDTCKIVNFATQDGR